MASYGDKYSTNMGIWDDMGIFFWDLPGPVVSHMSHMASWNIHHLVPANLDYQRVETLTFTAQKPPG